MPFPYEHSARFESPEKGYIRFRRTNNVLGTGVSVIWGIPPHPKTQKVEMQAIRFNVKKFTASEAKTWLKKHNLLSKVIKFEAATMKRNPYTSPELSKALMYFIREESFGIKNYHHLYNELKKSPEHSKYAKAIKNIIHDEIKHVKSLRSMLGEV